MTHISHKVAVLAKEKGFAVICDRVFLNNDIKLQCALRNYPKALFPDVLQAPTQSLLQKWLRDKHNLNVTPDTFDNTGRWEAVIISIIQSEESRIHYEPEPIFNTYEEALELGLLEALKLI